MKLMQAPKSLKQLRDLTMRIDHSIVGNAIVNHTIGRATIVGTAFRTCLGLLGLGLGLINVPIALAQTSNDAAKPESRWYQVEVVIFARGQDPQTASELWRRDIHLSYPLNWVELVGREPLVDETDNAAMSADNQDSSAIDDSNNAPGRRPAPDYQDFDPLRDIAFHVLPEQEFNLKEEVRRLQRNRYRVLFHEAWRQRLVENDPDAPAILISGGDTFGNHTELEGSLTVRLRRWLHVETNLWLTYFVNNFGQEVEHWPELPPRPNLLANDGNSDGRENAVMGISNASEFGVPGNSDDSSNIDLMADDYWQFQPLTSQYDNILSRTYLIDHIVAMKENRKVQRSEELHYIDHPQMGVLVYFKRFELPQMIPEGDAEDLQRQLRERLGIPTN